MGKAELEQHLAGIAEDLLANGGGHKAKDIIRKIWASLSVDEKERVRDVVIGISVSFEDAHPPSEEW